jgi:WD40 repeat protein
MWDANSGKELLRLGGQEGFSSAAFSPDGRQIVTASFNKTACVWDAETGKGVLCLSGHDEAVNSASYSRDGLRITTTSDDGTARVWDATSGKELLCLRGLGNHVHTAAFHPDGTRLVTASSDRTARVWRALALDALIAFARTRVFRELTEDERREYGLLPKKGQRTKSD